MTHDLSEIGGTLTGGAVLAGFHTKHRETRDLDRPQPVGCCGLPCYAVCSPTIREHKTHDRVIADRVLVRPAA